VSLHQYKIKGITLTTGDLICTRNGDGTVKRGEFWWFIGKLIPGEIDHIAIYIGPGTLCIESGPNGVIEFNLTNENWDAQTMYPVRGFIDRFKGVAFPLANRSISLEKAKQIRLKVATYCKLHVGKPYNLNFFDLDTEEEFYCSQLAYKAYLQSDINLNTTCNVYGIPKSGKIVFPQEIWSELVHIEPSMP
jgi:uncharacterized protein YycO